MKKVGLLALLMAGSASAADVEYSTYLKGELTHTNVDVATDNQDHIYFSGKQVAKFNSSMELLETIPEVGTNRIAVDHQGNLYMQERSDPDVADLPLLR